MQKSVCQTNQGTLGFKTLKLTEPLNFHLHSRRHRYRTMKIHKIIQLFVILICFSYSVKGQISYAVPGSNYTQNFDAILSVVPANNTTQSAPALPAGWVWVEAGAGANATYRVDNGSSATNDFYLLGATGSTERAIGGYSNTLTSQWGTSFTNITGVTLTEFTLTYTGEEWRDGGDFSAVKNVDAFSYSINSATSLTTGVWTNVAQLNFQAPVNNLVADVTLNGNAAANKVLITFTVTGISWPAGQTLWIRWTDPNETGNDDAMGIDDVTFMAAAPTITTSVISPLTYCSGSAVSVPYTKTGTFNAGNIFTAQLSDATGSFAAPTNIGTLTSTAAGTIAATIPVATPTGTLYRIRVIGSNPATTGSINVSNITITNKPSATISYTGSPYCTNYSGPQSINLTGTPGGTFTAAGGLSLNSSTGLVTPATSTANTYTVTYTMAATGACPQQTATTNIVINQPTATCIMGTGVINVPSLPYISNGRTTCGKVNDMTAANTLSCGITTYLNGEDEVFIFTPAVSGNINITLTSNGSRTGLMLYDGCPLATNVCSVTSCIGYEQSTSGNKILCANVTAGKTYYLIVDSWANPACNAYNIQIDAPVTNLPGATCATAVPIPSLPIVFTNESTKCHGNDYSNASIGSCGTPYESGEDKVYSYVASGSECIGITITGANSNSIGFQVYGGCPGSVGATCIGNAGGAVNGTLSGTITLPSAGTYYIVVDNQAAPNYVNYNLSIASFGAGIPNDLPCNATPLTLGISYVGSNTCSAGINEPSTLPACWGPAANPKNTVWFSLTAPASGKIRVRAIPNSLTNPQIAMYSGVCGTSMTLLACSDDATGCGTTTNYSSDLQVSGLTPGATYYIVVDGYGILTGSFGILAIDGGQALPALSNGQDCGNYIQVCDTTMSFGNPGFQSFGNICDFSGNGANCLNAGERGSAWFEVDINANGFLEFSIVPKDWTGPSMPVGNETDYDYAVWKIGGAGAVTCADIASPNDAVPISCNYSALGITGTYSASNGVAPPQYPGYGGAFSSQIAVSTGDKYAIIVSNYATSTSGFDITFGNTSPVSYGGGGLNSVNWSGGVDTDWFKKENWGGCAIPSCSYDAIINGGIVLQPTINGSANAKSVVINPGASLILNPNRSLTLCENFTNFGTFTAATSSTVIFNNPTFTQTIDGNVTGANAFGGVTVTKSGSSLKLLQDADMKGNFTISNGSSAFNGNSKKHSVGGNFTNFGFYLPGSNGSLTLNGNGHQDYDSPSNLNRLIVNNSGASVIDVYQVTPIDSSLTLTSGILHTNVGAEVQVFNRAVSSVNSGNNNSYVDGILRRYINPQGSYDFPLGIQSKGYQLANINFNNPTNPTAIDNIMGIFQTYSPLPPPLNKNDCGTNYSSPPLNNGYWFFDAINANSGSFDMTLYNQNFTNSSAKYTIMSFDGFSWDIASGNCAPSIPTAVTRTGMNGLGLYFGTAQGPSPLPIELVTFSATARSSYIELDWKTLSEKNNSGFAVERADAGGDFKKIAWVNGAGTTTIPNSYSLNDQDVKQNTIYYYRLRQLDFDGKGSFSPTVAAQLKGRFINASVFPNPITNESMISYFLEAGATVSIYVVNELGQETMIQNPVTQEEGAHHALLNSSSLAAMIR